MKLIAILTPAKTLTKAKPAKGVISSAPQFFDQTEKLKQKMQSLSAGQIKSLLKVGDAIAMLNYKRYQVFDEQEKKPAALFFDGAAHRGLNAQTFSKAEQKSAQSRVRIVSGLYGLLRPFDLIQPYRLEMGTKLAMAKTKTLYDFWDDSLSEALVSDLADAGIVVNCCSQEYAKAIRASVLEDNDISLVTCVFPGPSVYSKRARGMMCRFITLNEIESVEPLKEFVGYEEDAHYVFSAAQSSDGRLVFLRQAGAPPSLEGTSKELSSASARPKKKQRRSRTK